MGIEKQDNPYLSSENVINQFLNISADLHCILQQDGYFQPLNPAWEKVTGYTLEVLKSMHFSDLLHPDDKQDIVKTFDKVKEGKDETHYEHRIICRDGSVKWLEWRGQFLPGLSVGYATARDITERKELILKLWKNENLFRTMIETADDLIMIYDADCRHIYVSPNCQVHTGFSGSSMLGKTCREVGVRPEQYQPWEDSIRRVFASGTPLRTITGPGPGRPWLSRLLAPVKDESGKVSMVITYNRDISEIKLKEELITDVTDNLPLMIAKLDKDFRYQFVNNTYTRYFGWTKDYYIGKTVPEIVGEEAFAKAMDHLHHLPAGQTWTFESDFTSKDGENLCGRATFKAIHNDGEVTGYYVHAEDITARKIIENQVRVLNETLEEKVIQRTRELEETNLRLGLALKAGKSGAFYLDLLNEQHYWSPEYCELLAIGPSERPGRDYLRRIIHPDDLAQLQAIDLLKESILPASREFRVLMPGNILKWFKTTAKTIFEGNNPVGIAGILTDITKSKQAESELHFKTFMTRKAGEIARLGAWSYDVLLDKLYWSDEICSMHELPSGTAVTTKKSAEYCLPAYRQRTSEAFHNCIDHGTSFDEELQIMSQNGRTIWIRMIGEAEKDSSGKVVKVFGSCQDIDAGKKAKDAEARNRAQFELAVRAGGVGTWDWNVKDNILEWDEQMFNLYGIQRENFSGAYDACINGLHPDDRQLSEEESRMALSGQKEYNSEFRVCWPDGSVHYLKGMARVLRDDAGNPVRMIGTNWDITTQKNAEKELLEAKTEAEDASRSKSEFLSRMSHELRTPLTSILGNAQLLEMGDLNSIQKKGVGRIVEAGNKLLTQINDVLDITRIDTGRMALNPEFFLLYDLTSDLVAHFESAAHLNNIQLVTDLTETGNLRIKADRKRLFQILQNLVSNAIRYNKPDGSVIIRTLLKTGTGSKAAIRFEVQDTGPGILPEDIKRLFKPFERPGAHLQELGGTGLGLAVVKKLVTLLQGTIQVESTFGEGSTFGVEIPAE